MKNILEVDANSTFTIFLFLLSLFSTPFIRRRKAIPEKKRLAFLAGVPFFPYYLYVREFSLLLAAAAASALQQGTRERAGNGAEKEENPLPSCLFPLFFSTAILIPFPKTEKLSRLSQFFSFEYLVQLSHGRRVERVSPAGQLCERQGCCVFF